MPGVMSAVAVSPSVTPGALGRQWYVDSVAGDDGNDGKTTAKAFASIAALSDIQAGDTINLLRGSHWREELTLAVDRVTVRAAGSGALPILDASNLASGWSKTVGRTNVYQFDCTPAWVAGASEFAVWEDGVFLARVADAAACDAAAGSHAISGTSGTITVYVHASTSNDPATNGKVYEHTQRATGISASATSGLTLVNIETRNNLHWLGSLRGGTLVNLTGCTFRNGNLRNLTIKDGSLTTCTIVDCYTSHDNADMLVINQDTPSGQTVTLTGCTVENDVAIGSPVQAFTSLYNTSGAFGAITIRNTTFSGNIVLCTNAYHMASLTLDGCTFDLVQAANAVAVRAKFAAPHTIANCTHLAMDGKFVFIDANDITLTITGNEVVVGDSATAAIYTTKTGLTITLTGNTFTPAVTISSVRNAVWMDVATGNTLTSSGNVFTLGALHYAYVLSAGLPTFTSDDNTFATGQRNYYNYTSYTGLAAWQAATSQDANSTEL